MAELNVTKAKEIAEITAKLVEAAEGRARDEVAENLARIFTRVDSEVKTVKDPYRPVSFAATGEFYAVRPEATTMEVKDQLTARLDQLCSMLHIVHGNGFESFDNFNARTKDNYLWSCSMLADECQELANLLCYMRDSTETPKEEPAEAQ